MKLAFIFSLLLVTALMSSVSAGIWGYDSFESSSPTTANINVNNTQFFRGYTPTTLRDWMQITFDTLYCELTGCNMTGDLNVSGDVTGDYFIGDGSLLTNIPPGAEVDPIWTADKGNYSTTADIVAFGYYNSTDFVITDYFTKSDILGFGYYNSSDFSISNYFTSSEVLAFNYYNSTNFNITDYTTTSDLLGWNYYNSSDFSISDYYTKTNIDNFAYYNASDFSIADYSTTAQAGALYATIDEPLWSGNLTAHNDTWTSTYNATYDAYNDSGWIINWSGIGNTDTTYTAGSNLSLVGTEFSLDEASVKTWLDTLYAGIATIFDGTWASLTGKPTVLSNFTDDLGDRGYDNNLNFTNGAGYYNASDFNITDYYTSVEVLAFGYYNSTDFVITDYFTKSDVLGFNYYNSSDFSISDYFTSAEVLAFNYYNSSDFSISDYFTSAEVLGFNYYNSSDFVITNYYTKTEILDFGYYNSSDFIISDYATNVKVDSIGNFSAYIQPTHLSNFTDDLGDRGYDSLSNFSNDLNIGNWSADKISYSTTDEADSYYATIDEPLWTANLTAHNSTWSSTYNATYDAKVTDNSSWNQTLADILYADITEPIALSLGNWSLDKTSYSTTTEANLLYAPINYGDDWNKTYSDTLYADISVVTNNDSWNQSLANTLYAGIEWDYNQTTPALLQVLDWSYYNATNFNITDYSTTANILAFGYYNSSDFVITDYFTKSDVLGLNYYNSSDFSIADYSTTTEILAFNYYNSSDFNISDYVTSATLSGYGYYNSSDFSISDYYTKAEIEGFGYYNSSNPQTETDPVWTADKTDYSTTAQVIAFGYYNSSDFVITDYYTKTNIDNFAYYNASDFSISDYFTSSEVLAFNYYNSSDFSISDYVTSVTLAGYNYYNSSDFSISDYYTKTNIDNFAYYNASDFSITDYYTITDIDNFAYYNASDFSIADYSTTAQADLLYAGIEWDYNQTTAANEYSDATFITLVNEGNLNVNSSDNWDNIGTINSTQMEDSSGELNIKESWLTTFWNTVFGTKDTDDLTEGSTNLYDNKTWNEPRGNVIYSPISEPLSLHLNQDNWNNDTDGYIYWEGQDTITFNQSKLEVIYYNATAIEVITGTGSGTISLIQEYDGISYNVTEDTSDYELRVNFTGITDFTTLLIRHKTGTVNGHTSAIQIWDYDDSEWEDYGILTEALTYEMKTLGVYDADEHIGTGADEGIVQVRFYQDEGVPPSSHIHQFDWVAISKGFGTPAGQEIDPIWSSERDNYYNTTEIDNFAYYNASDFSIADYSTTTAANLLYAPINYGDDWNKTYADTLYADISVTSGNLSWNETLANTLYYSITNPSGFYNSSDFSITDYYPKTDIDNFDYYNASDFSIADYYLNTNPANYWNDTWAGFNKTYADTLYQPTGSYLTEEVDPIWTADKGNYSTKIAADLLYYGITNPSAFYNASDFSITDYYPKTDIDNFAYYNASDFSITDYYPKTDIDNFAYYNASDFSIADYSTTSAANLLYAPINYGDDWNKTLADTLYADISVVDNSSWNQSLANGLYVNIDGDDMTGRLNISNQISIMGNYPFKWFANDKTTQYAYIIANSGEFKLSAVDVPMNFYYGGLGANLGATMDKDNGNWTFSNNVSADYFEGDGSLLTNINGINQSWNQSLANILYYSITNPSGFYNSSDFSITDYYPKTDIDNFAYYNASDFSITDYYPKTDIDNFAYYNATDFSIADYSTTTAANLLYAPINYGDDWNKTYADTLYRLDTWDNFTGIPVANPSSADTTHLSTAKQIYDWAVELFMQDLVDDTAPQLGGYLDADGENIGATDDEIENIYVGDTTRVYFGNGQDASVYFNGTNLIISG